MGQKSLKYRVLLKAFRHLPVKKIMSAPTEKTQKVFRLAYKGEVIPKLHDPELSISTGKVNGSSVLFYRHRQGTNRLGIYLVGGGMLKYPKPSQAKGLIMLDLLEPCF